MAQQQKVRIARNLETTRELLTASSRMGPLPVISAQMMFF